MNDLVQCRTRVAMSITVRLAIHISVMLLLGQLVAAPEQIVDEGVVGRVVDARLQNDLDEETW